MVFPNEIVNDIKTVLDITSRVDERVKIIQENQSETHDRLNQLSQEINALMTRISVLESRNGPKIYEEVKELEVKIEKLDISKLPEFIVQVGDKLNFLDRRVSTLEESKNGWSEKIRRYSGLVIQGIWAIIVSYLLYKLGLSRPSSP